MERHVSLPSVKWLISLKRLQIQTIRKRELNICRSKMLTSSAVVSEEHINTSSELGRDGEVSCMYKDSTVPRMSSAMEMSIIITNSH